MKIVPDSYLQQSASAILQTKCDPGNVKSTGKEHAAARIL